MMAYEQLIMDELDGDTPRQKFEALKKLKDQNSTYYGKLYNANLAFKALAETPTLESIKSIMEANEQMTRI